MTALYIILPVLAVIMALSFVRINLVIDVAYNDSDNVIFLKYLFIKIKLFPRIAKEAAKEAQEAEEISEDKEKKGIIEQIKALKIFYNELKDHVLDFAGYIFTKALTIEELNISAVIGTGDPMYTGIAYGAANGFVYNMISVISRKIKLKNQHVDIRADFDNQVLKGGIHTVIHTKLVHVYVLLGKLIRIAIKYLFIRRKQNV